MNGSTPSTYLLSMLRQQPQAYARIRGGDACPGIAGTVFFYQTVRGAVVAAEVSGLPQPPVRCAHGIFAFHIHAGSVCSGTPEEPFQTPCPTMTPAPAPIPITQVICRPCSATAATPSRFFSPTGFPSVRFLEKP